MVRSAPNSLGAKMVAEDLQATKKRCVSCEREFSDALANCPDDGTVLIPIAQDPWVGKKLTEHYEILSIIGHGGMGVVYKAKHDLMERIVAIKMLLEHFTTDAQSVRRFQHEAKAASRLSHPNIITLHDYGVSPTGQPYLVMDYLEGISLSEIIKTDGKIGADRGVKIFLQVCEALEHAHRQGLVHRDLKPGNVMLVKNNDTPDLVKVVDFGVSKIMGQEDAQRLTKTGEICGSPVYMSPEQCEGKKLDPRSDVYSMGVLMYEALTGELPLMGKTMVETMSKHLGEKPQPFATIRPDLYIPERLEKVVFHCLEKDPSDRPQSMGQLRGELLLSLPPAVRAIASQQNLTAGPAKSNTPTAAQLLKTHIRQGQILRTQIWIFTFILIGAAAYLFFAFERFHQFRKPIHKPVHHHAHINPRKEKIEEVKHEELRREKLRSEEKRQDIKHEVVRREEKKRPQLPLKRLEKSVEKPKQDFQPKVKERSETANPWDELESESSGKKYGQE